MLLTIHQIYILVYLTVKHQSWKTIARYRMVVPFMMKWMKYVEELSSIDRAVKMSKSTEIVTEWLNMVLMNTALDLFSLLSEYDVFKAGITF